MVGVATVDSNLRLYREYHSSLERRQDKMLWLALALVVIIVVLFFLKKGGCCSMKK